jgi:hypothetical protein
MVNYPEDVHCETLVFFSFNRLIVSLAVADLMVACFVMGPAAHYMVKESSIMWTGCLNVCWKQIMLLSRSFIVSR